MPDKNLPIKQPEQSQNPDKIYAEKIQKMEIRSQRKTIIKGGIKQKTPARTAPSPTKPEAEPKQEIPPVEAAESRPTEMGESKGQKGEPQKKDELPKKGRTVPKEEQPEAEREMPKEEGGLPAGEAAAEGLPAGEAEAAAAGAATAAAEAGATAAASEAATAGAAVSAPAWLPIIIIIILFIVALIIIIGLTLAAFKKAGRTLPNYPDYNSPADAASAGKVLATSQQQDASLIAKTVGLKNEESAKQLAQTTTPPHIALATENKDTPSNLKEKSDLLYTNTKALKYSPAKNKTYVKEKIIESQTATEDILNNISQDNSNYKEAKTIKDNLTKDLENFEEILNAKDPILYINPFDAEMIRVGKVDKRIIAVLEKLVDFHFSLKGEEKTRYSMFKVGRIFQADPYDKKETPLEEEKEFLSAHHFGQALDITVVGKYKCKVKKISGSKVFWQPCYVYYQGGGPPVSSIGQDLNYASLAVPLALAGASQQLGPLDLEKTRSFWGSFADIGEQVIREEMGIASEFWFSESIFSPQKILVSYLAQKTSLPPQAIESFLKTHDKKSLARGLGESMLNLPLGSLEGNSWNEIFINTYKSYVQETLGLTGVDLSDFSDSQALGKAILQKNFGHLDQNKIFTDLARSNVYYENLWHLDSTIMETLISSHDINALAQQIGEKFKTDFIQTDNKQYIGNWLGLPYGNFNDENYQISAGRYVLARALGLKEPEQAFKTAGYFFDQAPFAPLASTDFCKGLTGSTSCPFYSIFENPSSFFNQVEKTIASSENISINFGGNLGKYLDEYLGTSTISFSSLNEILENTDETEALNLALSVFTSETLENNLQLKTELPGIFEQIDQGNWAFSLRLLGLNKIASEAVIAPNVLEKLTLPDISTSEVIKEIAAYKALEAMGINPWSVDHSILKPDWFKDPEYFANTAALLWLKNYGIDVISLDEKGHLAFDAQNITEVMSSLVGDEAVGIIVPNQLAAFFGLGAEEMKTIITEASSGQLSLGTQAMLSQRIDEKLGLNPGSTAALFLGTESFNEWLKNTWKTETILARASLEASEALDLPEGTTLDLNLLKAGVEGNGQALEDFAWQLGKIQMGEIFGIQPEQVEVFLADWRDFKLETKDLQNLAIEKLAANIAKDKNSYDALLNLYQQYFKGNVNKMDLTSVIASNLNIPTVDAKAFTDNQLEKAYINLISAQITKNNEAILGDKAITYNEVKTIFLGDQTKQTPSKDKVASFHKEQEKAKKQALKNLSYAMTDAMLVQQDPDIPIGISKIIAEGSDEQQTNLFIQFLSNKAGVPSAEVLVIKNLIEGGDIKEVDWQSIIAQDPHLSKYSQLATVWNDLANFANEFDTDSLSQTTQFFIQDKTGVPISEMVKFSKTIDNLENMDFSEIGSDLDTTALFIATVENFVDLPGFEIAGIPFDLGDVAMVLAGADPMTIVVSKVAGVVIGKVLGGVFGVGKVKCEDPEKTTQKQIRTTIAQILETKPYPPLQIITLRKEDVNYFSGLTDQGEPCEQISDILFEKYGEVPERGNKGMFISPMMWDHIHVGY